MGVHKIQSNDWRTRVEFNQRDICDMKKKIEELEEKCAKADQKSDDTRDVVSQRLNNVVMWIAATFFVGSLSIGGMILNLGSKVDTLLTSSKPKTEAAPLKKVKSAPHRLVIPRVSVTD